MRDAGATYARNGSSCTLGSSNGPEQDCAHGWTCLGRWTNSTRAVHIAYRTCPYDAARRGRPCTSQMYRGQEGESHGKGMSTTATQNSIP
jgi:hypothetical protein